MAGPVAHIFCALAVMQSGALSITDQRAFIIGTCYPDVQYLGDISRQTTHAHPIRWQDVAAAPSDFHKGILLHALVDEVREALLETSTTTRIPVLPFMRSNIMKFYEDSVLYDKITNWQEIRDYFTRILDEEKMQRVPDHSLKRWHRFIRTYCAQKPSALSTHAILDQFPHLRARIPTGIPSLISKIYMGIAFRSFKRKNLVPAIEQFYHNCVPLLMNNAHLAQQPNVTVTTQAAQLAASAPHSASIWHHMQQLFKPTQLERLSFISR
jgi:hypothetical protein